MIYIAVILFGILLAVGVLVITVEEKLDEIIKVIQSSGDKK